MTNDMQKKAQHQLAGKRAKAAGQHFEQMIAGSCGYYFDKGLAFIEKTPEPMKPLGPKTQNGRFMACYEKAAQPDFKGTLAGGRSIVFEAKHTDDSKIERSRLTPEQMDSLEKHQQLGAYAFVLVSMGLGHFYRIPWTAWRDMADTYGRKYIKREELEQYEIPAVAGYIKLLAGLPTSRVQQS